MTKAKASAPLFAQLKQELDKNGSQLVDKIKGLILFKIDDAQWVLDLRPGQGSLKEGPPDSSENVDLTLTITDDNFVKLVLGKMSPQQAFLLRRLKINGSMGMALKLQPILDAAAPKSKL